MNLTNTIWTLNIIGECLLLAVIFWRRDHVRYSAFTMFVVFCVVRSLVLVALYPPDSRPYAIAYFVGTAVRVPLILAVLFDMLYWIVKPFVMVSAPRSAMYYAAFAALCGIAAYVGLTQPAGGGRLFAMVRTADRSIELALGGTVLMLVAIPRMRQRWNKRERGIVLGFLYVVVQFAIYAIAYRVDTRTAFVFDLLKMTSFTMALVVWLSHFLTPEGALASIGATNLGEAERIIRDISEQMKTRAVWRK